MERKRISEDRARKGAEVVRELDALHVEIGRVERARLRAILECDRRELWRDQGARSHAEFLAGRYGIAQWKARRWIGTSYALEHLPLTAHALVSGTLCLDKVVELTRFATPATEKKLIAWARRVTSGGIRARADAEIRASLEAAQHGEASRSFTWHPFVDGSGFYMEARLPTPDASVVIAAIERLAKDLPGDPPTEDGATLSPEDASAQKRADALVALCSARIADDHDPDRATVVVHAPLAALTGDGAGASIAGGSAIHARTAQRLACDGRLDVSLYDDDGRVVGIGSASREPSHRLRRQVLQRDSYTCTFPGCEMKRFLHLHHIHWWEFGGPTELANLIAVCHTHHKLVHEFGWSVTLQGSDIPVWFRPSGRRFDPGPAPPSDGDPPPDPLREPDTAPWPAFWHMLADEDYELAKDPAVGRFLRFAARTYGPSDSATKSPSTSRGLLPPGSERDRPSLRSRYGPSDRHGSHVPVSG